jgi:hypothetical protein
MDYILRDIDAELWSKVKVKATQERKSVRDLIFDGLKWYITPMDTTSKNTIMSDRKKKD